LIIKLCKRHFTKNSSHRIILFSLLTSRSFFGHSWISGFALHCGCCKGAILSVPHCPKKLNRFTYYLNTKLLFKKDLTFENENKNWSLQEDSIRNILISPFGIEDLLIMTQLKSEGQTSQQISTVRNYSQKFIFI